MARPSAASRRIEPSETPAKARPSHSPQTRRSSIARRVFCASRLMSSSASDAASTSSALLSEPASARIAASRVSLSSLRSCMAAVASSSSFLTAGSCSASRALSTKGSMAGSAPPVRAVAAACRSALWGDSSVRTESASAMRARTRLFTTISTFLPSTSISPSAADLSTSAAFGSPSATSAAIAAIFSSLSSEASFSSALRSSAKAEADMKRAASAAAPFPCNSTLDLLVRHQRGLVLLLVVARDKRAPGLRLHRALGLPDDRELAVGLHFADVHRLVQVMVLLVHLGDEARGRLEGLAVDRGPHLVDLEALRLLDRLLPHVDADVGCFHRIVGERLVLVAGDVLRLGKAAPLLRELAVLRVLDRHEVVPCREMADERLGVHAAQLLFAHRERAHRNVGRVEGLVGGLLIGGHVRVAVDRRDHRGLAALGELLDVGDDRLIVGVAEGGVDLIDVLVRDPLGLEERAQDLVRGAWIDVVGAEQHEALGAAAVLGHQVLDRRDRLLVGRGARVEHVLRDLLAFVLYGVEEKPVQLLEHRQHGLARHRGPAAEDDSHLILRDELARLLGEERPVGGRVDHHRLDLHAHDASLGVDLLDRHERDIFKDRFADRHRSGERVEDADLDRLLLR